MEYFKVIELEEDPYLLDLMNNPLKERSTSLKEVWVLVLVVLVFNYDKEFFDH